MRPPKVKNVMISVGQFPRSADTISQLKRAFRYLLVSKLNTARAVAAIEHDPALTDPEVRYLVEFIRGSRRGVIVRRPTRRVTEEMVADE